MQRHDLPVSRRGDLTDEQWERIYPYLPVGRKGRPFDNVRDTVNGILWILRTGSPWRDLPPVYGNSEGVYHHSRNMKVFFFWAGRWGKSNTAAGNSSSHSCVWYEAGRWRYSKVSASGVSVQCI